MTKFVIKRILPLVICLAALLIGYNYFWGTPEEKENSREIIAKVKDLTSSVTSLLVSEKDKFDEGKYDDALDKVKSTLSVLREKATAMGASGQATLDKLGELDRQREDLEGRMKALNAQGAQQGGRMMASASGDGAAAEYSNAPQDNSDAVEAIRQEILRLNQAAADLTSDFE